MAKLSLPTVTLCAATSVNLPATLAALRWCLDRIEFAECLLFTDCGITPAQPDIRAMSIAPLRSGRAYSEFMLSELEPHIRTSHCLVVQWDGFLLDPAAWDPAFLDFDYIGAPWPQFRDGHDVGNGGFSLRSRRLLEACHDTDFQISHPEDLAIARTHRTLLEQKHGVRFADRATAERFAFERGTASGRTFGFHGVFNMIQVLGADRFWKLYRGLDDPSTALVDYRLLMRQLGTGQDANRRRFRLVRDRLRHFLQPDGK